ncbi:hypothetical protein [Xanthomonas sp. CFBP 8445]|uniref:hypothetical protein n=1 Tax=Xanthomonas sp. CFBP 8445 TaxID=2971236 RepID=UPI0021DFFA7A|nr:hypothetical protein [Xanthomonas sp. CFBP 8445]UYC12841.1 hypothetical protein NUG21_03595 [Xanthomonas sp. CFBP 8445]
MQSIEEKVLALTERAFRSEARLDLMMSAVLALVGTHPEPKRLLEEWRILSSIPLANTAAEANQSFQGEVQADETREMHAIWDEAFQRAAGNLDD